MSESGFWPTGKTGDVYWKINDDETELTIYGMGKLPGFLDMNEVEYGLYQIRNSDNSTKNGYASVNVVALWDGWAGDSTGTPQIGKKGTYIYEIGKDIGIDTTYVDSWGCVLSSNTKDLTKNASWITDGEVNMGDKETLVNFLNWVNERYEAKNVIRGFSLYQDKNPSSKTFGRIPNRYDAEGNIIYNNADGTLWFIREVVEYGMYTGDKTFLEEMEGNRRVHTKIYLEKINKY